jgi:hypothetical protein
VRGSKNSRMQRAGLHRDIVAVAAVSRQDGGIFETLHGPADMATRSPLSVRWNDCWFWASFLFDQELGSGFAHRCLLHE